MIGAAAQVVNERLALSAELPHIGLEVGGQPIDRDEQRELAVAERVEDLSVVPTRPDPLTICHESQLGDVVVAPRELGDRTADPPQRKTRLE